MTQETETSGPRGTRNAGINLSYDTLRILDELRGDIPKSKYTLRLIERAAKEKQQKETNDN